MKTVGLRCQDYKNRHSTRSKVIRFFWRMTWLLLASWTPDMFGVFNHWRILLLRLFGARIGKSCVVKSSTEVWYPPNLVLGDYSTLSERTVCYNVAMLTIGKQVTIGREAFLCTPSHDITSPIMELIFAPITIMDHAWVASRASVMPGRIIGEGGVVASGSVVTKDVLPWTVVGGNPARFIKQRTLSEGLKSV